MTTEQLDASRVEAFGGRLLEILNHAGLAFQLSVGHRTGLFDTMAGLQPSTSEQVAQAAGLDERYVREWLGALTVGEIVYYEPAAQTYHLPAEHAAMVTRAAGPDNLAGLAPYMALVGQVEDQVIEAFEKGGGVPYSSYPKFQELQRAETAAIFDATLVDRTLPLVPGLVEKLETGIDVADFGTGGGHAINVMAKAFPNSRFVGFDISDEGLDFARGEAREWGLENARFEARDIAAFVGEEPRFDLITTFDVIHDLARPAEVLDGIHDTLKPGGTYFCADMAASSNLEDNLEHPLAPLLYTFSIFYCMTTSLAQGGAGLGTMWGEQKAIQMLGDAGFKDVAVERVEADIINSYYICHK
ncbi:MAG: methyltransferase domain-containing protein [Dehalococcoidia bacterium]|nr:methyltransferase domain-containing protein [Dehalococcoidia bacterium]